MNKIGKDLAEVGKYCWWTGVIAFGFGINAFWVLMLGEPGGGGQHGVGITPSVGEIVYYGAIGLGKFALSLAWFPIFVLGTGVVVFLVALLIGWIADLVKFVQRRWVLGS